MDPCRVLGPPMLRVLLFHLELPCGWCSFSPREKKEKHTKFNYQYKDSALPSSLHSMTRRDVKQAIRWYERAYTGWWHTGER